MSQYVALDIDEDSHAIKLNERPASYEMWMLGELADCDLDILEVATIKLGEVEERNEVEACAIGR